MMACPHLYTISHSVYGRHGGSLFFHRNWVRLTGSEFICIETNSNPVHRTRFLHKKVSVSGFCKRQCNVYIICTWSSWSCNYSPMKKKWLQGWKKSYILSWLFCWISLHEEKGRFSKTLEHVHVLHVLHVLCRHVLFEKSFLQRK